MLNASPRERGHQLHPTEQYHGAQPGPVLAPLLIRQTGTSL